MFIEHLFGGYVIAIPLKTCYNVEVKSADAKAARKRGCRTCKAEETEGKDERSGNVPRAACAL